MTTGKYDIYSKDFDLEECMAQAQQGNPDAQVSIAYCYILGINGLEEDERKGFEYAQLSANQGSPNGFDCLAECYARGWGVKQDKKKAFYWYQKSAEEGFAEGMCDLGRCYKAGIGTKKNEGLAFEWFQKAVEAGDVPALLHLAGCYMYGIGTDEDEKKAFGCYQEAAEKESPVGMWRLGECYELGLGTEKDEEAAFEWYQKAADRKLLEGIERLGWCYLVGIGTKEDEKKGRRLLEEAADRDSTFAMFWLALHHENKEEWEKSSKYLKKGMELGDCDCQVRLGRYYHEGLGVTRDDHKAYDLIHKAAVKYEDGDALYWLSWCYHEGIGVAKDEDMADTYYRKAVEKGYQEPEDKNAPPTLEEVYEEKINGTTAKSNRQAVNYKQDKKKVENCIAFIQTDKGEGSGFVIRADGLIATCEHVIGDAKKIHLKLWNASKEDWDIHAAEVYKADKKTDSALLKIKDEAVDLDFLELDVERKQPDLGEGIVMYGYPLGTRIDSNPMTLNVSFARGYVSSNNKRDDLRITTLDIHAVPGNSGSPIISGENGKVIGHLTGAILGSDPTNSIEYMIPVEYIKELLSDADGFHPEGNGKRLDSKKSDEAKESKQSAPTASKPPKPVEEEEGPVAPAPTSPKPLKTWASVKKFIKNTYKVADEEKTVLALDFPGCDEDRTQRVFVEKMETKNRTVWISVLSCIGLIDDDDIDQVLEELGEFCYGGLVKMEKRHWLRYAVLMDSVSEESLLDPIENIAYTADELEKKYIGGDQS